MPNQITCEKCGSIPVYWSLEEEEFVCEKCHHRFYNEELTKDFKYSPDLVDLRLSQIPEFIYDRKYIKKIDLSAEPYDSHHAPFANFISSISSKIGLLEDLEEFDITYNNIKDLPPEISNCKKLKSLLLSRNCIRSIPKEIGKLKKLKILSLRYNCLDSLPDQICELTSLEYLYLAGNRIKKLPENIGSLINLKILDIEINNLRALPRSILNLTKLEELNVSANTGLISPPIEIAMQGMDAIKEWFEKSDLSYNH
jgi:Leucine-rich repeat (LRR) protein